jgi:hypothetical protein
VEWERDDYVITSDAERLDREVIRYFLATAYPAAVPEAVVERTLENSLVFGLIAPDGEQIGFARVLIDRAAVVYLADVFVHEGHRDRRAWLLETVLSHPELEGMRQVQLASEGAHSLHVVEPAGAELVTLERFGGEA